MMLVTRSKRMLIIVLCPESSFLQESKLEGFWYAKPFADKSQVIITRTYFRPLSFCSSVTITSQVSEPRTSLLVSVECLSDSMSSFNLMAPKAEPRISPYARMIAFSSGTIEFACEAFFVLLGSLPHDLQAIQFVYQSPILSLRVL